jgi:hypothetical protein
MMVIEFQKLISDSISKDHLVDERISLHQKKKRVSLSNVFVQ